MAQPRDSRRSLLPFIILLSVIALGLWVFSRTKNTPPVSVTANPVSIQTPSATKPSPIAETAQDIPVNWETYTGEDYSFDHPTGLQSDTNAAGEGAESIRFRFMGPVQANSGRTQTELFDGYAFVVTKLGAESEKTVDEWADERRNGLEATCVPGFVMSDLENITLGGGNGVQYSVEGCFADHTSSYVEYNGNVYEITQLYVGVEPAVSEYKQITTHMLNSLKFL